MKKGSWVTDLQQIGHVKDIEDDGSLDIVIFDRSGDVVGRTSPAMDGPPDFEPCCNPDNWKEIHEPIFPLSRNGYIRNVVRFIGEARA